MTHDAARTRNAQMRAAAPGLTYQQIADLFGVSLSAARWTCKGLCIDLRRSGLDWSVVDWLQSDVMIAERLGVTRERVRQVRHATGAMPSPLKRRRRVTAVKRLRQVLGDDVSRLAHYCIDRQDVARLAGVSLPTACVAVQITRVGRHPWHAMDWSLPNCVLEKCWRLPFNMASTHRSDHAIGPATYDGRFGRTLADPEFPIAVALELEAAEKWRAGRQALLDGIAARAAEHGFTPRCVAS